MNAPDFSSKHPDQAEVVAQNAWLVEQGNILRARVQNKCGEVIPPPMLVGKDANILSDNTVLRAHVNELAAKLVSPPSAPAAVPAPPAKPTPVSVTALSGDEVSVLNWTERTQYAGGYLSVTDAKKLAAPRLADLATLARKDPAKLTVDERVKILKAGGTVPPLKKI